MAISGSLTFSIPGIEAYPLLCSSSAIRSLAALLAIGRLLGPVERTVDAVIDGVLDATIGDRLGLGREYHADRLRRALLAIHAGHRSYAAKQMFESLISGRLDQVPQEVHQRCVETADNLKTIGIDESQLRSIAEWAFSVEPRTMVLSHRVEVLATAVVSTYLRGCRIAVINCHEGSCQTFNDQHPGPHGFAVFYGGTGQEAIQVLHQRNWLQPYFPPPTTRINNASTTMRLKCPVSAALHLCTSFLQSVGIAEQEATLLFKAIKRDAVIFFAREITIVAEEQEGNSYTSLHNTCFFYEYVAP